jgi:hypothetical protein
MLEMHVTIYSHQMFDTILANVTGNNHNAKYNNVEYD